MRRPDISDQVIHFTRGDSIESAFETFWSIVRQSKLVGAQGMIRGQYRCVCFTEAPLDSIASSLAASWNHGRYSPFGFMFDKDWLFGRGARPAIYQSPEEYDLLPESHRWRHVTYSPDLGSNRVDFTWEREWRLKTDALALDPTVATLVVPNMAWRDRLLLRLQTEEDLLVRQYSQIMDPMLAEQYRGSFRWPVHVLWKDCD